MLSQGLRNRMGSIAYTEFDLRLLEVTADCLLAESEGLRNLLRLRAHGRKTQDGFFPGCQAASQPNSIRIRACELLQAQCRKASGRENHDPYRPRQDL